MSNELAGELGYKDRHGRVWRFRQRSAMWLTETLDEGHTKEPRKADYNLLQLLGSIDREEFTTDDRSAQPLESRAPGGSIFAARRESEPESIEEIRRNAGEINGSECETSDPESGPEERGE